MSKEPERRIGFDSPSDAAASIGRFVNSHFRIRRAVSGFLDLIFFSFPVALIMQIVVKLYEWRGYGTAIEGYKAIFDNPLRAAIFLLLIMIKDIWHSTGKRLMRLKLVAADGSRPPLWKRVLRNVSYVVAQIEAIVLIFSGRRITDWILGLNVVDAEEE